MNVHYTGVKKELPSKMQSKLDAKFAKLSKLLERRGEREAHVVITQERHLNNAEITIRFYDHQLVAAGSDSDVFTSLSSALDKLEKQAVKQRGKWREKGRRREAQAPAAGRAAAAPKAPKSPAKAAHYGEVQKMQRIFKVNHHDRRKPMTLEEAMLEMENDRDYLVYRDAEREGVTVLVRRRDGHFDLIEA